MKNIDFNVGNVSNETALHIMVQRKRLSPAISLVCHGADIDAVAANGQTPLHYAVLVSFFIFNKNLKDCLKLLH